MGIRAGTCTDRDSGSAATVAAATLLLIAFAFERLKRSHQHVGKSQSLSYPGLQVMGPPGAQYGILA